MTLNCVAYLTYFPRDKKVSFDLFGIFRHKLNEKYFFVSVLPLMINCVSHNVAEVVNPQLY